jgi:peptidoglycan/LPS O-acetylase OafA/YrhL
MITKEFRRDGFLDFLRSIAVTAVVSGHFFPHYVRSGRVGVSIFFVLSGFLIASQVSNRNFFITKYFIRRFFRIWPVFLFILAGNMFLANRFDSVLFTDLQNNVVTLLFLLPPPLD